MTCDCGSKKLNHPGHSHWCSSLKPKGEYIGWQEFLDLTRWNVMGTYIYVTDDPDKLNNGNTFIHGHIVDVKKAKDLLNTLTHIHECWIESDVPLAQELYDDAVIKMPRTSVVRMLYLRHEV